LLRASSVLSVTKYHLRRRAARTAIHITIPTATALAIIEPLTIVVLGEMRWLAY